MISTPRLFMLLLGCKPPGRHTEQHDIFFDIATSIDNLKPAIISSWPEAAGKLHIDTWREVTNVNGFAITIEERNGQPPSTNKLFFINLGGYKQNDFEEYHYKLLVVAAEKGEAIKQAKQTAFYKHYGFPGADSHIDDKYGIDVDDIFEIEDILPQETKDKYSIKIQAGAQQEDALHIGYLKLSKL